MSEQYYMQDLELYLRHLIMEKYPGAAITRNSDGLTIDNMLQIITKSYEELSKDVKPIVERLMCNDELSKKYGCELDWYYTTEEAKEYLADEELFKGSFGIAFKECHSAEYLFDDIDKENMIIKDAHIKNDKVHLECRMKYRDLSGYCPKNPIYNKEILTVRAENTEVYMKVIMSLIAKYNPHSGI